MTDSGIVLEGNLSALVLITALITTLVAAFLVGRLDNWRRKEALERSTSVLKRFREEEQVRLDELRSEREGVLREALRARDAIERWETIKQDHQNLDAMRTELETFEREESNRIDELERRRAESARRLGEIQSALDSYPPEITGDEAAWTQVLEQRKREFDELRQAVNDAKDECDQAEAQRTRASDAVARLESRRERLNQDIEKASDLLEQITQEQIGTLKPYNERLLDEATQPTMVKRGMAITNRWRHGSYLGVSDQIENCLSVCAATPTRFL